MTREAQIPLALWISAAIVAHLAGGSGAVEVAKVYEDRAQFLAFVHGVRDGLRPAADTTFEILTDEASPTPPLNPPEAPNKEAAASDEVDPDAPPTLPEADPAKKQPPKPPEVASSTPQEPPPPEPEKQKVV